MRLGAHQIGVRREYLTPDELLVLDGKCRPEVQAFVDREKREREMAAAGKPEWLARVLAEAERTLLLEFHRNAGQICDSCGAEGHFDPVYVRGPKKGKRNHRKKRVLHPRVSSWDRYFCLDCWEAVVLPAFKRAIEPKYEVRSNEIETKAYLDIEMKCEKCGTITWSRDSNGWHRCSVKNCPGFLRNTGVRAILPLSELKVAGTMMKG